MKHPHMMKKPRNHAGLAWEGATLSNEFVDVNRMALDDRYGKVGAPLSKRRNGVGFTDGNTIGLFGLGHVSPVNQQGDQDVLTNKQLDHYFRNQRFLAKGLKNYKVTGLAPATHPYSSEGRYGELWQAKDTYIGDPPPRTTAMVRDNQTWAVVSNESGTRRWEIVDSVEPNLGSTFTEIDAQFEPVLLEDMYYTGTLNEHAIKANTDRHTAYVDRHDSVHKDIDAHRRFHATDMRDQSVEINWEENKPISNEMQLKYGVGIGFGIVALMFVYDQLHRRTRHPEY